MHIYTLSRGDLHSMKIWENDLAAQFLPIEMKIKGKIVPYMTRLAIRRVFLHEIVCPKDCEATVMGMIRPQTCEDYGIFGRIAKRLFRILGLKKPIKKYKEYTLPMNKGVSTIVLGTKNDKVNWEKAESANSAHEGDKQLQEML